MRPRRGRRHKQLLLEDFKGKGRYWKWQEVALGCTVCRGSFDRGCGPVVRQTAE